VDTVVMNVAVAVEMVEVDTMVVWTLWLGTR
jgi:hypothetical protein